ncbi:amidohydrolase family protein [Aspergillus niger]|nr:amidohydrolase family protein [Aspergillus niger]
MRNWQSALGAMQGIGYSCVADNSPNCTKAMNPPGLATKSEIPASIYYNATPFLLTDWHCKFPGTLLAQQLPQKIDIHHHFVPDFFRQGAVITGNNDTARSLARRVNEYAASLRDQYPDQLGFFAALPSLLDVPGTLAEIEYSLDTLKADGVTVFTRYGDGNNYLGHSQFTPIWKELDTRKTVVHIHPTMPEDTNWIDPIMPPPMLDFPQETTRTAIDMIVSNVTQQFPNCPKVLSHAGGTLPYLISRVAVTSRDTMAAKGPYGKTYFELMEALRSFYYDLALSSAPAVLNLLLDLIPHDHIMYGSDYPNAPPIKVAGYRENLDAFHMNEELRDKVYFGNAQKLLSRN